MQAVCLVYPVRCARWPLRAHQHGGVQRLGRCRYKVPVDNYCIGLQMAAADRHICKSTLQAVTNRHYKLLQLPPVAEQVGGGGKVSTFSRHLKVQAIYIVQAKSRH